MRTAIDTNVISALWSGDPTSQGMAALLGRAQIEGGLVISAPVYVELMAHPKATVAMLQEFLERTRVVADFALDEVVCRRRAQLMPPTRRGGAGREMGSQSGCW
jgi:predicted nucleic acid-binding protein